MLFFTVLACSSAPPQTTVRFETADIWDCQKNNDPHTCLRAAIANPDAPELKNLLTYACAANLEDSCMRMYRHAESTHDEEGLTYAMFEGCRGGDDFFCDKYQEFAATEENPAQKAWILGFVAQQRSNQENTDRSTP